MTPGLQYQLAGRLPTIIVGYFAFIVYGSLIPFELRDYTFPEAIEAFRNIRYLNLGVASRGDWVANILLYIPLGFLLSANGYVAGTRHGAASGFGADGALVADRHGRGRRP